MAEPQFSRKISILGKLKADLGAGGEIVQLHVENINPAHKIFFFSVLEKKLCMGKNTLFLK